MTIFTAELWLEAVVATANEAKHQQGEMTHDCVPNGVMRYNYGEHLPMCIFLNLNKYSATFIVSVALS